MAGNSNSGRKTKTLADLPGDWKKRILDLGKEGKTLYHVYDAMGVSEHTFNRIVDENTELKEVMDLFRNRTKIFWTDVGQDLATGVGKYKEGNANAWRFNMQNRVGWSDRVSTENETTIKADESAVDLFSALVASANAEKKEDSSEQEDED